MHNMALPPEQVVELQQEFLIVSELQQEADTKVVPGARVQDYLDVLSAAQYLGLEADSQSDVIVQLQRMKLVSIDAKMLTVAGLLFAGRGQWQDHLHPVSHCCIHATHSNAVDSFDDLCSDTPCSKKVLKGTAVRQIRAALEFIAARTSLPYQKKLQRMTMGDGSLWVYGSQRQEPYEPAVIEDLLLQTVVERDYEEVRGESIASAVQLLGPHMKAFNLGWISLARVCLVSLRSR